MGSRERVRNERAYSPDFHMRVGVEVVVARVPGSCRRPPDWAWRRCRGARIPRESRPARVDHSPERRPWLPRLSSYGGCPPRGSGWLKHHDRRVLCGFAPWPIWAGGDSSGPGADTRRGNVTLEVEPCRVCRTAGTSDIICEHICNKCMEYGLVYTHTVH